MQHPIRSIRSTVSNPVIVAAGFCGIQAPEDDLFTQVWLASSHRTTVMRFRIVIETTASAYTLHPGYHMTTLPQEAVATTTGDICVHVVQCRINLL